MRTLIKLLPLISFIIPFLILYFYRNTTGLYFSFEMTWKGRTYYLFFIWLFFLETILGWDKLQPKVNALRSIRTIALALAFLLPTMYIISSNYYAFPSKAIVDWAWQNKIDQVDWMPLHFEYLILAMLSILIIWLQYGTSGLKSVSISPVFMVAIGTIYLIDNLYRYGQFTPFQILVPTTAQLAGVLLNLMGYTTQYIAPGSSNMPTLYASNSNGSAVFSIAWPCSGVESLIIYTLVILLFMKKDAIPWWQKLIYYAVGAVVTYVINILRIVTIFVIAVNKGDWNLFHNSYGQLYSITWIISYPLIIIGSRLLWGRIKSRTRTGKNDLKKTKEPLSPRPSQSQLSQQEPA